MDDKDPQVPLHTADSLKRFNFANSTAVSEENGTHKDGCDMHRMGKLQVLRRQFKFLSIFGFAVMLGNTWEYALIGFAFSLYNGGSAGGIWMLLIVCCGMFFVTLSFAEIVSMAPTSGGQYHWVSELAPKKHQRFLSYVVGWLCVIGWQTGMASTAFAVAQQIEALMALNMPSFVIQGWHGTLLSIAVAIFSILWNTLLVKKLPLMEGIGLVLHVFGFIAFLVVFWVMGPRGNTKDVWTRFEDPSGWGSTGVATLVGILGPLLTLGGADSAVHLAEEVKDAAYTAPRAMIATACVNYFLAFIMTVTVYSTLGDDPMAILSTTLPQPWVQVALNATGSKAATNVMIAIICILLLFCSINQVTCSSRQLWSFARDKGLPCSGWLGRITPGWYIPLNAVIFTLFTTAMFDLIIIGSTIAFNILVSISFVALTASYMIVIGCMIRKRVVRENLLPAQFSLGKGGMFVNLVSMVYLSITFVFTFFPSGPNPELISMNWSCLLFGALIMFSMVYYYFHGRHHYEGPVEHVKWQDPIHDN